MSESRGFSALRPEKFSVFHTVFDVKFWWNFPSHTQTPENVAQKISRQISRHPWQRKTEKILTSVWDIPNPLQEASGPLGPKRPGECPRECPRKPCPRECPGECLGGPSGPRPQSVQTVSRECLQSVRTPFWHSRDTFWTLWGPGPEGPPRHSPGHSLGHPGFRGHSLGHSPGHFGPEGPEASCRGLGMSQTSVLLQSSCSESFQWNHRFNNPAFSVAVKIAQ